MNKKINATILIDDDCICTFCNNRQKKTYLEISLISFKHSIEPLEQLLGAVIAVEDDRDAVVLGHQTNVLSSGDGAEDGALLLIILDGLAGHESGTTIAELWS